MDSNHFDVLVLGTGLTEAIAAAALSKAGWKVVHVDTNYYYGADEASLTLEDLVRWCANTESQESTFSTKSHSTLLPPLSRQYSLSLSPSLIPSTGPLISSLISSGVARYGGFKLLERAAVYHNGQLKTVPGSKEAIFKSQDINLVDKRRLMRFMTFATGEFEVTKELEERKDMPFVDFLEQVFFLNQTLAGTIAFALAFCTSTSDPTLPALIRIRQYLRSAGRYGPSPFLVGHYGGLGELAQGFCRTCAVAGGTYILGRQILALNVQREDDTAAAPFEVLLSDLSDPVTADVMIAPETYLPAHLRPMTHPNTPQQLTAFCIAIVEQSLSFSPTKSTTSQSPSPEGADVASWSLPHEEVSAAEDLLDTGFISLPPGAVRGGSAHGAVSVLINGEDTMSCPRGTHILYLSTPLPTNKSTDASPPLDPESLLRPYVLHILSLITSSEPSPPEPLFTTYYTHTIPVSPTSTSHPRIILSTPLPAHFATNADSAALNAETIFWAAVKVLPQRSEAVESFWPPLQRETDDEEE